MKGGSFSTVKGWKDNSLLPLGKRWTNQRLSREALNKSSLARRRLCGMGCAKGDDANGATA
jgi:hypothetical protein